MGWVKAIILTLIAISLIVVSPFIAAIMAAISAVGATIGLVLMFKAISEEE